MLYYYPHNQASVRLFDSQRRSGTFYSCKWEYPKIGTFEGIFIVLLLLNHQCNPDSLSAENNYSEEVPEQWSSQRVFRLFVNNNENHSQPNATLKQSSSKTNDGISTSDPMRETFQNATSNLLKKSGGVVFNTKSDEGPEESYLYDFDIDQNHNPFLPLFQNDLPLTVPTKRTGTSSNWVQGPQVVGSESAVKFGNPHLKNSQREPEIFPASSQGPYQKVKKPKRKLQKRRKQTHEPLHRFPPISSIKQPRPPYSPELLNRNNVSLKATFLTPETEESSSIELELSSTQNQETKIQFANPDSQCVQILDTNRKRTLLNVWSFSKGKLKLESQREVPASIFNGSQLLDGALLNRAEIPEPVANELSTLLTGIGRTDNVSLLTHFHLPASGETFFGGNRRRNVIMFHYILWGDREKAWRVMLDKTVESYLRNYFMTAFSSGRSVSHREPINWRKMRNVLLSFMASPDANCTKKSPSDDTRLVQREELVPNKFYHLKQGGRPRPLGRPGFKRRPQGQLAPSTQNDAITRNEYGGGGGYGWQQNGWGAVEQQGWESEPQGWGWEDQGGKEKGKKKKGKKKKKKKKGKKKKKKKGKKKGKKKKKKKGGGDGWGGWEPQGWGEQPQGWGPPKGHGWGPIKWNSLEINVGEILHKGLALVGLFGLPIALFVGACVIVYLISTKHGGGWGPQIYSSYHQQPASPPQILFSGSFPRFGWRRRTERPYDDYGDSHRSPSTNNPYGWKYSDYQSIRPTPAPMNRKSTSPNSIHYAIKPIKAAPQTFADIKKSNGFRYNEISETYPRIRNQGDSVSSMKEYEKRNYNYDPYYSDDHYYDQYEANSNQYKYQVIPTRTKQEEDLVKILSKHKKARLEKLLQKWKLEKKQQKSWW